MTASASVHLRFLAGPIELWELAAVSERFVRGWKVSLAKLDALVGSNSLTATYVFDSKANAACRMDLLMTLGEGKKAAGKKVALAALAEVLSGKLDADHAYDYARVTELLLNHATRPLGDAEDAQILLQLSYYVPNDSHGRWNPLFEACDLLKLSEAWAASNFRFPWTGANTPDAEKRPWPIWTVFEPSALAGLQAELKSVTEAKRRALPDSSLARDPRWAEGCRRELGAGLGRLRGWVDAAQSNEPDDRLAWTRRDNALVLLMDGDR